MDIIKSYWVPVTEYREIKIRPSKKTKCHHVMTTTAIVDLENKDRREFCVDCGHVLTWSERQGDLY